ncbi:MAG: cyclic nucleotide-binding domain-containing protein, partial [Pseudolabrys sp.]|nr:cyclic nucleotide-binding domain-containing protein [Pseudolabrys sp.]
MATMSAQALTHTAARTPVQKPAFAAQGSLSGTFDMIGAVMSFGRNEEIYGEGEAAEYLYKVKAGCVRTYKVLSDGRRQVGAFYLPGDVFGIEAAEEHGFSAEAILPSTVVVIKRSVVNSRASGDSSLASQLLELTIKELQRAQC